MLQPVCMMDHQRVVRARRGLDSQGPPPGAHSDAAAGPATDGYSALGLSLLTKWSWGVLSATAVQELADAAVRSGCHASDVIHIASCGAHGSMPSNINRDIMRIYCRELSSPDPYVAKVPMAIKDAKTGLESVQHHDLHFLLPHQWLAAMDKASLLDRMWSTSMLHSFWSACSKSDPRLQGPLADMAEYQQCMVPVLLHADGGAFTKRDSLMVISMKSILSSQAVADSMLLLAALPKKVRAKGAVDSMGAIWKVLAWSFTAMFEGRHPSNDPEGLPFAAGPYRDLAGKPLCPNTGLRAVVWAHSADMEYYANELGISKYHSNFPCSWCQCNKTDVPWNDFRPGALWRATCPSPVETQANNPCKHIIMTIPGVIFETLCIDTLHVLELGVSCHCLGNLFADLCTQQLQGTKAQRLSTLRQEIAAIQVQLGIQSCHKGPKLEYKHFMGQADAYPELHSWKAREVRYLVPVGLHLANKFDTLGTYSQHRAAVFKHLHTMYQIIDDHKWFVPSKAHQGFKEAVNAFLAHYQWLAKHSATHQLYRWSQVPKHHFTAHIPDQALFIAPRAVWTYAGEAMVGNITALAQACTCSTSAQRLSKQLIAKHRVAMHLKMTLGLADITAEQTGDSD